jgi:lipopolysaccharide transport system permease protein
MSEKSVTIIEPHKGWKFLNWKEIKEYRDLFYFMVLRDITVVYKQTVLGFAWAILNPLFSMVVFTVVFSKIAGIKSGESGDIPYYLFSFTALVPWTYFSQALTFATNSLVTNTSIFTKVYFPRLIIPFTPVVSKLVDFFIAFGILLIMCMANGLYPTWQYLYIPYLLMLMIMTAAGIGSWLSALAVQYRDVKFAITFIIQLLMYLTPVVWPTSLIDQKIVPVYGHWVKILYGCYPLAGVIEGFRAVMFNKPMPWDLLIPGSISAVIILLIGTLYFRKTENIFADVA